VCDLQVKPLLSPLVFAPHIGLGLGFGSALRLGLGLWLVIGLGLQLVITLMRCGAKTEETPIAALHIVGGQCISIQFLASMKLESSSDHKSQMCV